MSRYIDADEFLENESEAYMRAQVNLAEEHADKTIEATRYVNEAVHKKIQMLINATESADVVEVRHGHWDFYGLIDDIYGHGASCSVCGGYSEDNGYYCSCCGAKMDDALQRKTNPEAFKGGDDYE